ncbi:DUF6701 domain-containing protein [Vibrio neptunius]|uniref:MSHA biogenesis protein MshQ n=1 Tax=Vibrio neptunius TaxID=170651 RepID=A0ABS3A1G7_9VIBR|nr:DUF6701 domain-containing protein [Vibrio neptunius]MBN3493515.1 MSHA biogenesis protein MshQ [Vibrio neptunius]MBN3516026.1 MSHA biogenesis protein MshQ [Vibrio neptunius]MBN3550283.1 MSHA biogenesis protein MshQ [Vibrio neptunius]MBN3578331.1 MSHA biogenesis protein MshQ [Vibrio neptunius]MCH9871995.1 MSHA biogenesis protein MshQ [Vibrio neptunius]
MKMMRNIVFFVIGLMIPIYAYAVPQCTDIFTDPPSGNHSGNGLVPPSDVINNKLGNLDCFRFGGSNLCWQGFTLRTSDFTPGDYSYNSGRFQNSVELTTDGSTTRLYFDSLQLTNAELNLNGDPEDLFIYVAGSLQLAGQNKINGIVYVAGSVQVAGSATISGALAAGGALVTAGNSTVTVDPDVIENADLIGMCDNSSVPLECFSDDFNSGSLSDLWVTSTSSGSFQPGIISSRLRFTQAVQDQATSATYQRLFPAKDNLVEIEFDHFAYNGSGADGIAVVLSDALVTPRAGAFGGPLGYGFKTNEPGFAGGWLGIGIDEYGNFSAQGGEGTDPGQRRQSVALRGSGANETGYQYLAGACNNGQTNQNSNCLSPTVDNNNVGSVHRYKIVVDSRISNQSQVEIFRKIGTADWQTIVGPVDVLDSQYSQAAVPEDFLLSITGSTGDLTNNHEIDNFQVCALNSRPIEDQIDHFRITHTGQGITCNKSEVTIKACKNDNCTELYTDPVSITLSPSIVSGGGGWEGGITQTITGGSETFYIRKHSPGSIKLDVMGSNPPARPFSTNLCQIGSGSWSDQNCNLVFSDSGFVIDMSDKYAAESVEVTLSAVKQGDSNTKCDVGFGGVAKSVALWNQYLDPETDLVGSPKVSVDVTGSDTDLGTSELGATNYNLAFDSNGQTRFNLNYDDAGHLQLNAKYVGTGDELGLELRGAENFVSFPKYLTITAENTSGGTGACSSADISCSIFAKAGENFNLKVTAYNQDNQVTPNYKHSNIAISHSLVQPSTGSAGSISTTSYSHTPILNGTNSVTQSVSEVGVFSFTVTPPSSFYGSTAKSITAGTTGNIGRFTPAYFAVQKLTPMLQATCDLSTNTAHTYIGQPFGFSANPRANLTPVSESGTATVNYLDTNWWRYNKSWDQRAYSSSNGLGMTPNSSNATFSRTFNSTNVTLELSGETVSYDKPSSAIEPFIASFSLTMDKAELTDDDGVCYQASSSGSCLPLTFEDIDTTMQLRWGRMKILDTYGSELSNLRQGLEIQYFSGGTFQTNIDDSCTTFAASSFSYSNESFDVITVGSPVQPQVAASLSSSTVSAGESWIEYTPPGAGNTGTITTSINLSSLFPWLRDDENGDGSLDDVTSGLTQFGLYRGSDRVIWWNEQN